MPTRQAEEVEDRAHPLRVAPGQVVVDGDDVDALAGDRVEDRGERRDEGLALAGAHLRDLALVEHDAADQLHVEVAHAERPLTMASRAIAKTSGRTSSRASWIASMSRLRRAFASSRRRSRSGWWSSSSDGSSGSDGLAELVAERREPLPDLRVGQGLDLFLELVGLVDERLDPLQLTVVRIDEPGKEIEHGP